MVIGYEYFQPSWSELLVFPAGEQEIHADFKFYLVTDDGFAESQKLFGEASATLTDLEPNHPVAFQLPIFKPQGNKSEIGSLIGTAELSSTNVMIFSAN